MTHTVDTLMVLADAYGQSIALGEYAARENLHAALTEALAPKSHNTNSLRQDDGRCGLCGGDWSVCGCQGMVNRKSLPQAALPVPPHECKTDAEKLAYAAGWWKALEANRAQPVRVPLTDEQIEQGRKDISSTGNPYCPRDSKTMQVAVRWAEGKLAATAIADDVKRDALRYRWLRDNSASISWNPSRYNSDIVSGFAHAGTGYLGFSFEDAIKEAMKGAA